MASVVNSIPKIDSIPNLRLLCKRSKSLIETSTLLDTAALYRSSKPDRVSVSDLNEFRKLGIKCIIDFRSLTEYLDTDGHRLLDQEYVLYKVILPKKNYSSGQSVQYERVTSKDLVSSSRTSMQLFSTCDASTDNEFDENKKKLEKRHFLINFFSLKYVKTVFNRLPWHLWCLGIIHLIWDIIVWNKFKTLKRFIASRAISTGGIFGQYVDLIEVSQPAICAALKLIADSNNLPALINCAFGKDRTGIMSALILSCLGMPKEFVVEEYAMSKEGLEPIKHLVYKDVVEKHFLIEEFCKAEPNTMRDLLTYIEDRYTSVEQYLVSIGFTEEEQMTLRKNLEAFEHKSHT